MAQYCVSLPEEFHQRLKLGAKKKHLSLSQYLRELVESGLEVERLTEASMGNSGNGQDAIFSPDKQKVLWKNLLAWSLESRILIRGLFEKILESRLNDVLGEVQKIKEKAEARALGLLNMSEDN